MTNRFELIIGAIAHLYAVLQSPGSLRDPVEIAVVLQSYLRSRGPFTPSPPMVQQMVRDIFEMIELPWSAEVARVAASPRSGPPLEIPNNRIERNNRQQEVRQGFSAEAPGWIDLDAFVHDRRNQVLSEELYERHCPKVDCPNSEELCCVCSDRLAEKQCVRINACSHIFHHECLHPWLTQEKNTCPLCRKEVCEEYILVQNRRPEFSQPPSPPSSPRVSVRIINLSDSSASSVDPGAAFLSMFLQALSN